MMSLLQNTFAISPRGHPFNTSNFVLYQYSKRLVNISNVIASSDHLKFASSSALPPERSVLIKGGKGLAALSTSSPIALSPEAELGTRELQVPLGGDSLLVQGQEGIGIVKYLQGKTLFVTGVTGFLAKVLIEKLLRTIPDVGKIYVLIKANDKEAAVKRLRNEIINEDIFKCLQQVHGNSYESFMLSKLVPVVGNLCEPNLGFDKDLEVMMAEDVDIIINSAGNTNFHERYNIAIDINTQGPRRVMSFAKKCKKLKLFLQISTAYVNGQREGRLMEKPFRMGESIARPNLENENASTPLLTIDIEDEIRLASSAAKTNGAREMKELGRKRANKYGWQNSYVFTKAMGEMLLDSERGDVPLVILRPSAIESTYSDPFPGWIEGHRMVDPIMTSYGKGHFFGFLGDPNIAIDLVPVDMVVNATLAALAKHGGSGKPEINVYQVATSVGNPLIYKEMGNLFYQHFAKRPCWDSEGKALEMKLFKFYNSVEAYLSQGRREVMTTVGSLTPTDANNISADKDLSKKLEKTRRKLKEQAKNLCNVYEPYFFYEGRFDNTNTHLLIENMSEEERKAFNFDVGSIDWEDYIVNIHIPGLRRHVMKTSM